MWHLPLDWTLTLIPNRVDGIECLVCHEGLQTHKMVTCEVSESATFKEMVVWPTVFDMQVLITNHFVLLRGKPIGGERQMKVFCKEGKVSDKEMNGSESLMKHRYQKSEKLLKLWDRL